MRCKDFGWVVVCLLGAPLTLAGESPAFDDQSLEFFEREVRPILSRRCFSCHSAKSEAPKGGLRLDSRRHALAGGDTGPAVVPGDLRRSLLIDAVNYGDLYQMPPKSKLPANEIQSLTRWIELGAPWPSEQLEEEVAVKEFDLSGRKAVHWCWKLPQSVVPPKVKDANWPQQELDAFVLAKLEQRGLRPTTAADKQTLIRRAYFDVLGLPPSPGEIARFIENDSPLAFDSLVDELLRSTHYGERWARHWLDLVRYAETFGHEFDYPIVHAYKYRDYVIRAFNADVPYNQFVVEQIAGDRLPSPRRNPETGFNESVIGTGFWWLGEATHAPVDVRDDEARRIENQIDVMSKTFLGLTVACARCHDHKFDAISTRDYYGLVGYLKSSRRDQAFLYGSDDTPAAMERIRQLQAEGAEALVSALVASDLTAKRFAANLLASSEQVANTSKQRWQAALSDARLQQMDHPLHAWRMVSGESGDVGAVVKRLRAQLAEAADAAQREGRDLPPLTDFSPGRPYPEGWSVSGEAFGHVATGASQWDSDASSARLRRPGVADSGQVAAKLQGVLRSPTFILKHPNIDYRIAGKNVQVRLILDGYFMDIFNSLLFKGFSFEVDSEELSWHRQAQDIGRYIGHRAHIEIIDHGDGEVRVDEIRFSDGPLPAARPSRISCEVLAESDPPTLNAVAAAYGHQWTAALAALKRGAADEDETELINWVLRHNLLPELDRAERRLAKSRRQIIQRVARLSPPPRVLAITDGSGENERVFIRGNHKTLGAVAPRQFLEALGGGQPLTESGSGRLELARRMVDPQNPLAARVIVNRVWHHLFGRGIVASVDNFGVLGQPPSHPDLLDYLALRFMREGWSIKRLIQQVMLSSSYQMASTPDPRSSELDPANRLLHSQRVRRLEGEVIRDAILKISGQLDPTPYGISVPQHLTAFMQGRGRPKRSGPLDGQRRRTIYLEVRRNFLSPMMLAFDTPIPFSTVGRRNNSNVPAQALILMNDPFVVQQASQWAKNLSPQGRAPHDVVEEMYLAAFSRPPTKAEIERSMAFLQQQAQELDAPGPFTQQAWADLAHVLINVKEFVYLR